MYMAYMDGIYLGVGREMKNEERGGDDCMCPDGNLMVFILMSHSHTHDLMTVSPKDPGHTGKGLDSGTA
jgi:hypothetical protein